MRYLFVFFLLFPLALVAQGDLPISIYRTIGTLNSESGIDIQVSSNDFVYVVSSTNGNEGNLTDVMLTCLDLDLNCVWSEAFGNSGIEYPKAMILDESNNIIITGTILNTSTQDYDVFVYVISSNGVMISESVFSSPSWQLATAMEYYNGDVLVLFTDYSDSSEAGLLRFNQTSGFSEVVLGSEMDGRTASSIYVDDLNSLYVASYVWDESTSFWSSQVMKYDDFVLSQTIDLTTVLGRAIINDIYFDELVDELHIAGEVHHDELVEGYYIRMNSDGTVLYEMDWDINQNYSFCDVLLYNNLIVLVGNTTFAGAGGKDCFTLFINWNGEFIGGPTFGGVSDEFLSNAVIRDSGEIFCVGTGYSFNGGAGDMLCLKLEYPAAGDYDNTTSYDSNCFTLDVASEVESTKEVLPIAVSYYTMIGTLLDKEDMSRLPVGYPYLEVQYFEDGSISSLKKMHLTY